MNRSFVCLFSISALLLLMAVSLPSCDENITAITPNDRSSFLKIYLTDAPGDYEEVNIDVREVQVKLKDSANFYSLQTQQGIYDLLKLQNGIDTLLVNDSLPPGELQEIRLILGSNNSVVVDSTSFDLDTPSAQSSGLKIKTNKVLVRDSLSSLTLDFDAEESIVERGNGSYGLKPVIRVMK